MHAQPVALVTGGSRGIGRGICQALAQAGHAVAINFAGNEAAARETQTRIGSSVETMLCKADVGSGGAREQMIDAVLTQWGRIDVLVNNAGITSVGRLDILDANEDSWETVLGVNLKGPFFLSQRVAREMIKLGDQLPRPAIVNVSSLSAYTISTNRGDYCISKAGLAMATKLWALRLAEYGIRVFEVCPGVIETDMTSGARDRYTRMLADGLAPLRRWGKPEDLGAAVAGLVGGAIPYSTGDTYHVDGGFHLRKFP